jgi:hypothetical protein
VFATLGTGREAPPAQGGAAGKEAPAARKGSAGSAPPALARLPSLGSLKDPKGGRALGGLRDFHPGGPGPAAKRRLPRFSPTVVQQGQAG